MNPIEKLGERITGPSDLSAQRPLSPIGRLMVRFAPHLLSCDPDKMISKRSLRVRKFLHPVLMALLPMFLEYRQVFESRNALRGIDGPDAPLALTDEPVIWCPTHGFKDDVAASIAATRHAYVLFGSVPMFLNTLDGLGAYINGVALCNRKVRASKLAAQETCLRLLKMGMDVLVFPEGVWNKTAEKLMLPLWSGAYRLAKETGSKIIPVVHYLPDPIRKYPGNVIHTVIGDPISMEGLDEQEGTALLRDTMAYWRFLLMEKYGQTTRQELLNGCDTADEAWAAFLSEQTRRVPYYDQEIELCADYRTRAIACPETVWQPIADLTPDTPEKATHIAHARRIVAQEKQRDFQRRF